MLTLEELRIQTDKIFQPVWDEGEELKVPQPSPHWLRKIEALEEAHLEQQRISAIFDMRCEQAKTMGFKQMKSGELVQTLMGEMHTNIKEKSDNRQNYEWFYNHHTGEILTGCNCNWGSEPVDYIRIDRKGPWYLAPFNKIEMWRCRFGKLDYLKREIPYGVVLRLNEIKKLNLFNVFNVLAPIEAWERKTDIDPIVTATIWSINKSNADQISHFFLAQW